MAQQFNETMDRMRFAAAVQKRSSPPRCHPISICIMIQGFGLIFVGLTLTLIANWPGATSVGSNPLRIAGPVILCFGVVVCIVGFILMRTLRRKAAKKWDQKIKAVSKQLLDEADTSFSRVDTATSSKFKPKINVEISSNTEPLEERRRLLSQSAAADAPTTDLSFESAGHGLSAYDVGDERQPYDIVEDDDTVPQPVRARKQRKKELAASSQEDLTEDEAISEAERHARRQRRRERKKQKELQQQQQQQNQELNLKPEIPAKISKPPPVKPKPKVEIPGGRESPQLRLHVRPAPGTTVVVHSGRATPPNVPHPKTHTAVHKSVESDI